MQWYSFLKIISYIRIQPRCDSKYVVFTYSLKHVFKNSYVYKTDKRRCESHLKHKTLCTDWVAHEKVVSQEYMKTALKIVVTTVVCNVVLPRLQRETTTIPISAEKTEVLQFLPCRRLTTPACNR